MNFYLISAILPDNEKTGGEIVLYRHFVQRKDFDFKVLTIPRTLGSLFRWMERSRFRTYLRAFTGWYEHFDLTVLKDLPRPSFILTVAHGRECFAAAKASRYWNVPLVTIFHDWYPASSDVHPRLQFVHDRSFRKLYRESDLALCVSDAMKRALGPHSNAIVLPPIPSSRQNSAEHKKKDPIQILYSGFCGGVYANSLQAFAEEIARRGLRFSLTGDGSGAFAGMKNVDVHGFVDEGTLGDIIAASDILVLFLSFDPSRRKHFSTHFPSKLVEYAGKKRLVGIWGPSWCTAVQWARDTKAAWAFDQPGVSEFVDGLLKVYNDDPQREQILQNANRIYENSFDPDVIHKQLVDHIVKLL